ncbi:MAG: hypothetical protein GWN13_11620 [Phycisphaerae bacterium]|nr:hypothetical protein [Phycisphaerae bacterium]
MSKFTRRQLLQYVGGLGLSSVFLPSWLQTKSYNLPSVIEHNLPPAEGPNSIPHQSSELATVIVGELVALMGRKIVVRDAEGLHPATIDEQIQIQRALGAPVYDLAPQPPANQDMAKELQIGDALWVVGKPSPDGSLHVTHMDVNWFINQGGIALGSDRNYLETRLQIGVTPEFENNVTRVWLASSIRILKLNTEGLFVPARLEEMNMGQHIGLQGYRAREDGSLIANTLLLGDGKPPHKS